MRAELQSAESYHKYLAGLAELPTKYRCRCNCEFATAEGAVSHCEEIHAYENVQHGSSPTFSSLCDLIASLITPNIFDRDGQFRWDLSN